MPAPDSTAAASGKDLSFIESIKNEGVEILLPIAGKVLIAGLIIIIGFWIVRRIVKVEQKLMKVREVDPTLRPFLRGFTNFMLKAVVLIVSISTLGVEMTSIIAILGSVGLAIGLALQGSLANFAGGILILTLKPFRIGDFIEAQGKSGHVKEISIITTTIKTLEQTIVYIPNGPLAGGTITNFTKDGIRRVDFSFGIGYGDDIGKAKKVIHEVIGKAPHILDEPQKPFVVVGELGASSVNITVRVWTEPDNYWPVYFHLTEHVKLAFDANGISIPFPQRDVHFYPTDK